MGRKELEQAQSYVLQRSGVGAQTLHLEVLAARG